jgi:hypothetical protein
MKNKPSIILATITAAVIIAVAFLKSPGSAPQGQESILTLSAANFPEFQKAFDADATVPRLLLLFSPT